MGLVLFAVALAVAAWAGLGVVLLLADPVPGRDPIGRVELLCLTVLYGLGVMTLLSFAVGALTDVNTRAPVTAMCALIGAAGVWRRRELLRASVRLRPIGLGALATVLAIGATSAVVWWFARHQPLGWDGAVIWEFKAQMAFDNGGRIPPEYYRDPTRLWSHPSYPPFMPLTEAWVYGWWRGPHQQHIKALFPVFFVVAAGMLHAGCARLGGARRWVAVLAPVLLLSVPMVVFGEGGASSGYVDFPLAACFLAAVVHTVHHARTGSAQSLRFAGTLAALLPWMKQEGLVLFATVVLMLLVATIARRPSPTQWRPIGRAAAWAMVPGVVVLGTWRMYLRHIDAELHDEYLPFTLDTLRTNADRTSTIAGSLWDEMQVWDRWSVLWPMMLLATVLWVMRTKGVARVLLPAMVVLPIALDSFVYYFSGWDPVSRHIDASLPRLLLQVAPVAVLTIALTAPRFGRPATVTERAELDETLHV